MHYFIVLLLACLSYPAVAAEHLGVATVNYSGDARYYHSDNSDGYLAGARLNLPLLRYGGVNLYANGQNNEADGNGFDSKSYTLGVTTFVRNPRLGKLNAGYAYSNTELDIPNNLAFTASRPPNEFRTYQYTAGAEYYAQNLTLGVSRLYANPDSGRVEKNKLWRLTVSPYWNGNSRLSVDATREDGDTDWGVDLSHQPRLFKNSTIVSLGYFDNGAGDESWSIGVSYHFDTRPSLIDRDRKYR